MQPAENNPLHEAAGAGSSEVVSMLIDKYNADIEAENKVRNNSHL